MTTYTPDLELRLAVAQTMPELYPNARIDACGDSVIYDAEWEEYPKEVPDFDLSFDAILPLVRELEDFWAFILWEYDDSRFKNPQWLLEEATPVDYCRAYLAAKES